MTEAQTKIDAVVTKTKAADDEAYRRAAVVIDLVEENDALRFLMALIARAEKQSGQADMTSRAALTYLASRGDEEAQAILANRTADEITTRMKFREEQYDDGHKIETMLRHAALINVGASPLEASEAARIGTFGAWWMASIEYAYDARSPELATEERPITITLVGPDPVPVDDIQPLLAAIVDRHVATETLELEDDFAGERRDYETIKTTKAAHQLAVALELA